MTAMMLAKRVRIRRTSHGAFCFVATPNERSVAPISQEEYSARPRRYTHVAVSPPPPPLWSHLQPLRHHNALWYHNIRSVAYHRSLSTLANLSKREMADLEDRVLKAAGSVVDPLLGQDLNTLQWLHRRVAISDDGKSLHMLLKVPSLLHPILSDLKQFVTEAAERELHQSTLPRSSNAPLKEFTVNVEALASTPVPFMARLTNDPEDLLENLGPGLARVAHIVAVYSCKGGVGKSTVAVNLAYQLAHLGGRIGLLDLDVYGPSLPILVRPIDTTIRRSSLGPGMVHPIEHGGIKLLSLGFVAVNSGVPGSGQNNGAAVMRGPMAGKVVTQLLKGTDWGDIDVLVLDLPPGTGDVQLQVLQDVQLSGAVAVSTPSKLAAVDTQKGIQMFTSLGVPTLAVVENMAYFVCEGGGKHFPFGQGLSGDSSRSVAQLPISAATNAANDSGNPLCLERPKDCTEELQAFHQLAQTVSRELLKLQYNRSDSVDVVTFDSPDPFDASTLLLSMDKGHDETTLIVRLFADSGAVQRRVSPAQLRSRDPQSGDMLPDSPFLAQAAEATSPRRDDSVMASVHVHRTSSSPKKLPSLSVTSVERKGRYGYAVHFADGATIIYSMRSLALSAGGTLILSREDCR